MDYLAGCNGAGSQAPFNRGAYLAPYDDVVDVTIFSETLYI
jgi:hypothetical protein